MTDPVARHAPPRPTEPQPSDQAQPAARHHAAVLASEVRRLTREPRRVTPVRSVTAVEQRFATSS